MGNAQSELQHIANALQGMGPDEKRFVEAVCAGKVDEAEAALKANGNVIYARTKEWENAWHMAAFSGSFEMMEILLRHGKGGTRKPLPGEPSPHNHKTKKGTTPLMVAIQKGNELAMQFLIGCGAKVRAKDIYGNTAMHYAALFGRTRMLELLLGLADAEEDMHEPTAGVAQLSAAARNFGRAAVAQLGGEAISAGGLQGLALGRYSCLYNEARLQPLHFAVWGGHIEAAKVLLDDGAKLQARSATDSVAEVTCNAGSTPLHVAALRDNVLMVQFLLEQYVRSTAVRPKSGMQLEDESADPRRLQDNYGFSPYQLAKNLKREEVLPLLDPRATLPPLEGLNMRAIMARNASSKRRSSEMSGSSTWTSSATHGVVCSATMVSSATPSGIPQPSNGVVASSQGWGFDTSHSSAASSITPESWDPFGTNLWATPSSGACHPGSTPMSAQVPREFICPITNQVMDDPAMATDGRMYEHSGIKDWFERGNVLFPGGLLKIKDKTLKPSTNLKDRIEAWKLQKAAIQQEEEEMKKQQEGTQQKEQEIEEQQVTTQQEEQQATTQQEKQEIQMPHATAQQEEQQVTAQQEEQEIEEQQVTAQQEEQQIEVPQATAQQEEQQATTQQEEQEIEEQQVTAQQEEPQTTTQQEEQQIEVPQATAQQEEQQTATQEEEQEIEEQRHDSLEAIVVQDKRFPTGIQTSQEVEQVIHSRGRE